jgi:uncharacterized protein YecT (DUF1311 family)
MSAFLAITIVALSSVATPSFMCLSGERDWECANREFEIVEQKLNFEYRELLARMKSSENSDQRMTRSVLIKSQRDWIKFREADCNAYELYTTESTSRAALAISCKTQHARVRTQQLLDFELW